MSSGIAISAKHDLHQLSGVGVTYSNYVLYGVGATQPNYLAQNEAKLDCNTVTRYGVNSLKYPESLVKCVAEIMTNVGSAKTRQYNFQGAIEDGQDGQLRNGMLRNNTRRQWVLDFAKNNFVDSDVLYLRDRDHTDHVAYGPWDYTDSKHEYMRCGGDVL